MPNLSKIDSFVFCTTASSVPSECVFSTAGELINPKRTRLDPVLAEDLLFLNKTILIILEVYCFFVAYGNFLKKRVRDSLPLLFTFL